MAKPDECEEKRLSRIQPSLSKLFDCPVCFERITPPVTVCVNGHAVCNSCRRQPLLSCPTCKAPFSQYKNTMLDQIIEENIFACKYSEKGCPVEMKFREVEQHEQKICKYRTIVCPVMKDSAGTEPCNKEESICHYYHHVYHNHPDERLQFSLENPRILDISKNIKTINVLKDVISNKIVFETIRHDINQKKFFITYQYVGNSEDANKYMYELRIYHARDNFKELRFKNLCVPVGLSDNDMEQSERCLVLNTTVLKSFRDDDRLFYSVRIEPVSRKWYQIVREKWKSMCKSSNTQQVGE